MLMKKMMLSSVAAAAVIAGAVACGGGGTLELGSYDTTGVWRGTAKVNSGADTLRYDFTFDLDQSGRGIGGTAKVVAHNDTIPGDSVSSGVNGRWDYPAVTLDLAAPGFDVVRFNAQFATSDTLRGTLAGSGLSGRTLKIVRQTP